MKDTAGSAPGQQAGASPGDRLRTERERKGISTQKVAEDLHVDPWIVEALEAGRFASLGPPVYAKGYLRRYATLLGLDAEALVAECIAQVQPEPELVLRHPAIRPRRRRVPLREIGIVAATIAVLAAAWWGYRLWQARAPAVGPTPVIQDEAANDSAAAATTVTPAVPAPAAESAALPHAQGPATVTAAAASATTSRHELRLRFSFAEDCWVELYGADGRRVFFDLGAANSARSFTMPPPLRVFLGYADGVQLEINGEPVALPANVRRGNVAHFILDSGGRPRPAGSLAQS